MKLTDLFLGELDREGPLTTRVLERVPEGRNEWQPHKKSMPLGRLAVLVAGMPSWIAMMIDKDEFDLNPPGGSSGSFPTSFKTTADLLKIADDGVAAARTALQKTNDDHLMQSWRLLVSGENPAPQPPPNNLLQDPHHPAPPPRAPAG